jgi:hypothetical protein
MDRLIISTVETTISSVVGYGLGVAVTAMRFLHRWGLV